MIQGTGSHVGKSVIATALCALFTKEGYRVAPFKSQNMALNSAVAADGGEIGRAQAAQAAACGIEPTTDMNPILLKPTGEKQAQVIVKGRSIGELDGGEYRARREEMLGVALEALDRLRSEYDVVVIEGAGSPAEVNLRAGDIVNMEIARAAGAAVILVTDIDRGGAFASLVGTMSLLTWQERQLVRGIIINKFRGDKDLLKEAIDFIEARCGAPVLGVVPWTRDIGIDAEDSVSLDDRPDDVCGPGPDVAVIKLPFISNFTDFKPLADSGAEVRYVGSVDELGRPDAVIIPGTKDTINDMRFLAESGLSAAVVSLAAAGTPVVGVCGGYQMLGSELVGRNGHGDQVVAGLGLLAHKTVMSGDKITINTTGVVAGLTGPCAPLSGHSVSGYEIHEGHTEGGPDTLPFIEVGENGSTRYDGACHGSLPVFGTYLHGLFDSPSFREAFLAWIAPDGTLPGGSREEVSSAGRDVGFIALVEQSLDMQLVSEMLSASKASRRLLPQPEPHGGRAPDSGVDLSENVNNLGPSSSWWQGAGDGRLISGYRLNTDVLVAAAARRYGVPESSVVPGAGSAELIYRLTAFLQPAKALVVEPTFSEYARAATLYGATVERFGLTDEFELDVDELVDACAGHDVVFLANPNNPTGNLHEAEALVAVARAMEGKGVLVVDEAFMDFVPGAERSVAGIVDKCENIIVLRSMGKMYALAGLRVGFLLTNRALAECLNRYAPPWAVSSQSSAVAASALADDAYLARSIAATSEARDRALAGLRALSQVTVYPSVTNFVLARHDGALPDDTLWSRLEAEGLHTRDCSTFRGLGLSHARIAVGDMATVERLLEALGRLVR